MSTPATLPPGLFVNSATASQLASATNARNALANLFLMNAAGEPVPGVIVGTGMTNTLQLASASSSTLSFTFQPGYAMVVRAAALAIGGYIVGSPQQQTVTLSAAATNPRIDVVYICHPDPEQGDTGNPRIDVLTGTPAASPAVPTGLPTNSLALAQILVPANATQGSKCTVTDERTYTGVNQAVPFFPSVASAPANLFTGQRFMSQASGVNGYGIWEAVANNATPQIVRGEMTAGLGFPGTVVNAGSVTGTVNDRTTLVREGAIALLSVALNVGSNGLQQGGSILGIPTSCTPASGQNFTQSPLQVLQSNAATPQGLLFCYTVGNTLQMNYYVSNSGTTSTSVPANTFVFGQILWRCPI